MDIPERLLQRLRERFGEVVYIEEIAHFEINGSLLLTASEATECLSIICPLESSLEDVNRA